MKKFIFFSIGIFAAISLQTVPVFADEEPAAPPIFFRAINAGYKDDQSAQNYDFFELEKSVADDLDLSGFRIQYFNSSDKLAGELEFAEPSILRADTVIFGFNKSPQFADFPSRYLYNFSSSGLASTAGRLKIVQGETVVDEICWGKPTCDNQLAKFATKQEENRSAVLQADRTFAEEEYYPAINPDAIFIPEPEPEPIVSCAGLQITEIYSSYEENSSEQFIELYNSLDSELSLDACTFRYKNKDYPLQGALAANSYTILQDILLTKDPSTSLTYELRDASGPIFSLDQPHGQKKGTSYILLDDQWLITYARTPGEDNVYQEFRTCQEGKIINPATGNCVNEATSADALPKICAEGQYLNALTGRCKKTPTETTTVCKDGYYLNPLTGRCKKKEATEQKTCEEGYELNPETNRCRKKRATNTSDYPVEEIKTESYDSPKIFIAIWAMIGLGVLILAYVIFQFRHEIAKHVFRRKR